ncbi:hypothetical protein Avbf_04574 [Armadillidium vulgare]|nr:hypothetical protein Avbf_04574 [Armadillidium vulgare]
MVYREGLINIIVIKAVLDTSIWPDNEKCPVSSQIVFIVLIYISINNIEYLITVNISLEREKDKESLQSYIINPVNHYKFSTPRITCLPKVERYFYFQISKYFYPQNRLLKLFNFILYEV